MQSELHTPILPYPHTHVPILPYPHTHVPILPFCHTQDLVARAGGGSVVNHTSSPGHSEGCDTPTPPPHSPTTLSPTTLSQLTRVRCSVCILSCCSSLIYSIYQRHSHPLPPPPEAGQGRRGRGSWRGRWSWRGSWR